jgi:carboxylesterase
MTSGARTPPTDPRPFALGEGENGVLCIHGLTGTPWEVRPLGDVLAEAGYRARGPLLAGHGDVAQLEASGRQDWYASTEQAFDELRSEVSGSVVVLGFSMGSLLALRLAAQRPKDIAGVIAMGVPLEFPGWQRMAISALASLREAPLLGGLVGRYPKSGGPDIRVLRMAQANPSLREFPYPTLREFIALQDEVRGLLSRVTSPLLLLHGRLDHAASTDDSARVAQAVSSADVRRKVFARSFHHLAVDLDREQVFRDILSFVDRVTQSRTSRVDPESESQAK